MNLGFKGWIGVIIGILLINQSILAKFGISPFFLMGTQYTVLMLAAIIFLILDGFGEHESLKTITLSFGFLLGIFTLWPLLQKQGIAPFGLPGILWSIEPWAIGIAGLLIFIGSFKA